MAKLNLNIMAKQIAEREGKKTEINIAQIKEVLKITLDILGNHWYDGNETKVIETIKDAAK